MTSSDSQALRNELGRLKSLLPSDPRNPVLLRHCAQLAIELGDYTEALNMASAALQCAPGDAEAMFHRASALMGMRHYKEASQCLAVLQAHGLTHAGIAVNRALCHYALGEFREAGALLEALIDAGEKSTDVLRLAVSTRHHLGDLKGAIDLADAHPEVVSQDGAVAGVYALAYLDAGRAADAERAAFQALAKNPDSVDGLSVRGALALSNMDSPTAETSFRRVLELTPENGRAWIGLGTIALLAGDLGGAKDRLERGVAAMPRHVGSWHVLGWTHLVAGDLDSAERVFEHALELERNFAETHGALAAVHAMRGRAAEARKEIAIADRLNREGLAARFATAVLAGQAGNSGAAGSLLRATIARLIPKVSDHAAQVLAAAARPPNRTRH
jgi:tetratricopeptide (TPR) repeat protein